MGRLTVRLPDSLHRQLEKMAKEEKVSLNQYLVYALTRQVSQAYTVVEVPEVEVNSQRERFYNLVERMPQGAIGETRAVYETREPGGAEPVMQTEEVRRLRERVDQALAEKLAQEG